MSDNVSGATISIPFDEFAKMQKGIADLNEANAKLRADVVAARLGEPDSKIAKLTKLARAMVQIVGFATGNMAPRDVRRWPHAALAEMAKLMPELPDFSPHDEEHVRMLFSFVDECIEWEQKRASSPEREVPPPFPQQEHPMMRMTGVGGELPSGQDIKPVGRLVPRDPPPEVATLTNTSAQVDIK